MKLRRLLLGRKLMTNLDSMLKSTDITWPAKVHLVKAMVFPVVMYRCESWTTEKSWVPKNWCFWTVVLEKTLESPLDYKEIQPVHSKGDQIRSVAQSCPTLCDPMNLSMPGLPVHHQLPEFTQTHVHRVSDAIQPSHPLSSPSGDQSWIFVGRTDVEAETPILWPPDAKSWLIWKDPDAGKDWGQEEKGMTEDEMVGWHHWLNVHGFGWTPGVGDGQGSPVCCSLCGHKESDRTERLNWTERE